MERGGTKTNISRKREWDSEAELPRRVREGDVMCVSGMGGQIEPPFYVTPSFVSSR